LQVIGEMASNKYIKSILNGSEVGGYRSLDVVSEMGNRCDISRSGPANINGLEELPIKLFLSFKSNLCSI